MYDGIVSIFNGCIVYSCTLMYDGYLEVCCICNGLYVVYLIIGKDCLLFTVPVCGVQKCSRKTGEQEPHATS